MTVPDPLKSLTEKLDAGRPLLDTLDRYVSGTQPLAFLAPEVAAATQGRLKPLNIAWPRLVVQSVEERLDVTGFRTPGTDQPDAGLWEIWQRCNLDEESQKLHTDSLVYGRSYAMIWADNAGKARITVESPRQVHVSYYPGTRTRQYGIKRWVEDGFGHAVVFTETEATRYQTVAKMSEDTTLDGYGSAWTVVATLPNPLGVVPIVPFPNKPRTLKPDGESELSDLLPIFDAINKLSTDLMVASEFGASPRRWATGIELPEKRDPDTGEPTGEVDTSGAFSQEAGRVWLAEPVDARLGQFPGADLSGFTNALANLTQSLGALSGLPPHYLGLHGDQPASADAIRSAEASLVAKVRRKQRVLSGGWEECMRIASAIELGHFSVNLERLETLWANPETRTVAQSADAATKLVQAGLLSPDAALEFYLDLTPTQVERNRELRRRAALDTTALKMLGQ